MRTTRQTRTCIRPFSHRFSVSSFDSPHDVGALAEHLQERDFAQGRGGDPLLFHLRRAVRTLEVSLFLLASFRSLSFLFYRSTYL